MQGADATFNISWISNIVDSNIKVSIAILYQCYHRLISLSDQDQQQIVANKRLDGSLSLIMTLPSQFE